MKKLLVLMSLSLISASAAFACDDLGNYPNSGTPELNCQKYINQQGYGYFRWVDNGDNTTECYGCITHDDDNLPQIHTPAGVAAAAQAAADAAAAAKAAATPPAMTAAPAPAGK